VAGLLVEERDERLGVEDEGAIGQPRSLVLPSIVAVDEAIGHRLLPTLLFLA
jgi:hypothetical protein